MRLRDLYHLSKNSLLRNKRRTLFTMLGLIIGVMSVMLVMSVGAGAQSLITSQVKKQGTNLVGILAGASDEKGPPATALGVVVTTLKRDDLDALKTQINHVANGAAYISGNETLQWRENEQNVTFTGATNSYEQVEQIKMAAGRFFTEDEDENAEHMMVLGKLVANDIFGNQNPVGQFVKLKRLQFKIIGVMAEKGSTLFENPDRAAIIPLKTAQNDLLGVRHVSFIRLRVDNEINNDQVVAEVKNILTERHDDEDFSVRTTAQALDILTNITNGLRFFLLAIAAVSLFVGGVGIMNIMLIAVKEKTREIGLRKAVGATTRDIFFQFISETIAISAIAGIIGILIGTFLAYVIAKIIQSFGYNYDFVIDPISIIVGVLVAAGIGILFGTAPARHAGKLNPIEALRYE